MLYVMVTGCQWHNLPNDFPNPKSVYYIPADNDARRDLISDSGIFASDDVYSYSDANYNCYALT